jgi:hypothetical protein
MPVSPARAAAKAPRAGIGCTLFALVGAAVLCSAVSAGAQPAQGFREAPAPEGTKWESWVVRGYRYTDRVGEALMAPGIVIYTYQLKSTDHAKFHVRCDVTSLATHRLVLTLDEEVGPGEVKSRSWAGGPGDLASVRCTVSEHSR